MLDIRQIRTEPEVVKLALGRRGIDFVELDRVADLDERQRRVVSERDELRNRIKALSKQVGALHKEDKADEAAAIQGESRVLGEREGELAAEAAAMAAEIRNLLLRIPNLPHPDAPDGASDHDNPVLRVVGFDPDAYQPHQRVPHWELGPRYAILDNERAVKISGAMFTMPRKGGATLARALLQYGLDRNADQYEEVRPPSLVSTATLTATGQLPKFADDAYSVEHDDLWA
ncbi:MAG: serine--tRNA ligase, partial [Acidimicrobiia bacterium]|nr:serine--tRNA ligase [Acidimicrobiia bacterium]